MQGFHFFTELDQTLLLGLRARSVQAADKNKDIFVRFFSPASDIEINAQRGSTIILQKSLNENLALTVMLFLSLFEEGEVVYL